MDDSSVRLSLRHEASVAEISKRLESFYVNLEASLARRPVGSASSGTLPNTRDSQPSLAQTTSQAEAALTTSDTPSAAGERGSFCRGVACVANVACESEGGGAVGDLRMRKAELCAAADLRKQTPLAEVRAAPATAAGELRTYDALSAVTHLQSDVTEARTVLADELRCPRLSELYEVGRELGRGHFGVVRLCEDRATGERFACKTILLSGVRLRAEVLPRLPSKIPPFPPSSSPSLIPPVTLFAPILPLPQRPRDLKKCGHCALAPSFLSLPATPVSPSTHPPPSFSSAPLRSHEAEGVTPQRSHGAWGRKYLQRRRAPQTPIPPPFPPRTLYFFLHPPPLPQRRSDLMELRAEVLSLLRLQEGEGERGGKEQGAGERGRGECGAGSADGEREELAFVRLYEVVVETRATLHLILEYCPGGDLFDLVIRQKRLTEAQAAAVFRQLLLAVHAMHRTGIVHRDLKPENILVSSSPGACRGLCTVAECNCSEIEGSSASVDSRSSGNCIGGNSSTSQGCSHCREGFNTVTSSDTTCSVATPPSLQSLEASKSSVSTSVRHSSSSTSTGRRSSSSSNGTGSSIRETSLQSSPSPTLPASSPFLPLPSPPPSPALPPSSPSPALPASSPSPALPPSSPFHLSQTAQPPDPSLASHPSSPRLSLPPSSPTASFSPLAPPPPPLPPLCSSPPPTHATTATKPPPCPCTGIRVRVADFGLAATLSRGQTAACGVVGSPLYMAPEIIRGRPYAGEVDMWSLGCVLYTCLSGTVPFHGRTHRESGRADAAGRLAVQEKVGESASRSESSPEVEQVHRLTTGCSSGTSVSATARHVSLPFNPEPPEQSTRHSEAAVRGEVEGQEACWEATVQDFIREVHVVKACVKSHGVEGEVGQHEVGHEVGCPDCHPSSPNSLCKSSHADACCQSSSAGAAGRLATQEMVRGSECRREETGEEGKMAGLTRGSGSGSRRRSIGTEASHTHTSSPCNPNLQEESRRGTHRRGGEEVEGKEACLKASVHECAAQRCSEAAEVDICSPGGAWGAGCCGSIGPTDLVLAAAAMMLVVVAFITAAVVMAVVTAIQRVDALAAATAAVTAYVPRAQAVIWVMEEAPFAARLEETVAAVTVTLLGG
ncbi:unnamed protein product [Closterium sp. Naga37s-1]|nr:unnamed protein product [Closterium sp. Naga37s-1]